MMTHHGPSLIGTRPEENFETISSSTEEHLLFTDAALLSEALVETHYNMLQFFTEMVKMPGN